MHDGLVGLPRAVMKYHDWKQSWGAEGSFGLPFLGTAHH